MMDDHTTDWTDNLIDSIRSIVREEIAKASEDTATEPGELTYVQKGKIRSFRERLFGRFMEEKAKFESRHPDIEVDFSLTFSGRSRGN